VVVEAQANLVVTPKIAATATVVTEERGDASLSLPGSVTAKDVLLVEAAARCTTRAKVEDKAAKVVAATRVLAATSLENMGRTGLAAVVEGGPLVVEMVQLAGKVDLESSSLCGKYAR